MNDYFHTVILYVSIMFLSLGVVLLSRRVAELERQVTVFNTEVENIPIMPSPSTGDQNAVQSN